MFSARCYLTEMFLQSDVGDPLVHKAVAVGMYAGGYYCGQDRFPDFYVDLAQFSDWIHDTVKANTRPAELHEPKEIYYKG